MGIISERARKTSAVSFHPIPSFGWILLSALTAIFIWIIAVPVLGIALVVEFTGMTPQTVSPGSVAAAPLVAGLFAWVLLWVSRHFLRAGVAAWRIFAAAVLVLSLSGPLIGGTTPAVTTTLCLMHLAVAGILVVGLPRAAQRTADKKLIQTGP